MTYLFDGINHPSAQQVIDAGANGCLMYGGTPGDGLGKDFTVAQYADYKARGLLTAFVYENSANDMATGMAGGAAHADALLADLHNKGVASIEPIGVTVDEHVTAANIPLAVQYQTGFYRRALALGWSGARGGYGFAEFLIAIHDAGVADWYWGAGNLSLLPAYVNIWQDNTGTILVGGAVDDKDWIRVPLPTGGNMELTYALPDPLSVAGSGTVAEGLTVALDGIAGKRNGGALANALGNIQAQLVTLASAVAGASAQEKTDAAATITAIGKVGQLDPTALEADLTAALKALGWTAPSTPTQTAAAVLALFQSQLAKP